MAADAIGEAYLAAAAAAQEAMRSRAREFGLPVEALPWVELDESHQGLVVVSVGAGIGRYLERVAEALPREVVEPHAGRLRERDRGGEGWVPFRRRGLGFYERVARQDVRVVLRALRDAEGRDGSETKGDADG